MPSASTSGVLLLALGMMVAAASGPRDLSHSHRHLSSDDLVRATAIVDSNCSGRNGYCRDCKTVQLCVNFNGQYYAGETLTCSSGRNLWCFGNDTDAGCDVTPSATSCNTPQPSTQYTCTQQDGYFPDPASCTRYYVCVEGSAYGYDCGAYAGTNYDPALKQCRRGAPCNTLRCPNPSGAKTQSPWTSAPWIYATCIDREPKNALLGACPQGQAYDGNAAACAPACQAQGRTPDTAANTHFFECVDLGGGKFSPLVVGECPPGTTFDATEQICSSSTSTGGGGSGGGTSGGGGTGR